MRCVYPRTAHSLDSIDPETYEGTDECACSLVSIWWWHVPIRLQHVRCVVVHRLLLGRRLVQMQLAKRPILHTLRLLFLALEPAPEPATDRRLP